MTTSGKIGWLTKDRVEGLVLSLVSLLGILHTFFGKWSQATGEEAKFFPRIIYFLMLATGLMLILNNSTEDPDKDTLPGIGLLPTVIFVGIGSIYFLMVIYMGLAVATFIYTSVMIALLTVNRTKQWKRIVLPALMMTVLIWAVFTYFMPIVVFGKLLI